MEQEELNFIDSSRGSKGANLWDDFDSSYVLNICMVTVVSGHLVDETKNLGQHIWWGKRFSEEDVSPGSEW